MKEPIVRFQDILEAVRLYIAEADIPLLRRAYVFAAVSHRGQLRKSGIPYLSHPLAVTKILTDLKMDIPALCGGLLHDVIEDSIVDETHLRSVFGEEIVQLVEGLTTTAKVVFRGKKQTPLESYRKMIIAMSKDMRVLMIKLADRLHNMRTLHFLSGEQQKRISEETLAIYAPLANRLGISWMRSELEDLSFKYLNPGLYQEIQQGVEERVKVKAEVMEEISSVLEDRLGKEKIDCEISGRAKHIHSIYKKMVRQGINLDQVFDLLAVRVIVPEERQCYQVLGIVHSAWTPIPARLKDYIAKPKMNGYRTLHTTVIGPTDDSVEIQIRSRSMHREAEQGIASHWMYKERDGYYKKDEKTFQWLRSLVSAVQDVSDTKGFLDTMNLDLFSDRVYVLTPKGEAKELPLGSTPIDFAYKIHTEVGDHCTGAKVNGKIVPLRYELQNGDVIEILTSKHQTPKKDWLKIVRTTGARSRIRSRIRQEEQEHAENLGKEILTKGLRKQGFQYGHLIGEGAFKPVLKELRFRGMEDMLRAVAYGKCSVGQIVNVLPKPSEDEPESLKWDKDLEKLIEKAERRSDTGITVRGVPNVLVKFAKCCNPVCGEDIVGFITRGRGVTVHSKSCSKTRETGDPERWIEVYWDESAQVLQRAKIRVVGQDQPGLLAGISKSIAAADVNISNAKIWATGDQQGIAQFEVMVRSLEHLQEVIRSVEKVKGVLYVERLTY